MSPRRKRSAGGGVSVVGFINRSGVSTAQFSTHIQKQ
jgi:hypothetical protein